METGAEQLMSVPLAHPHISASDTQRLDLRAELERQLIRIKNTLTAEEQGTLKAQ
jgi:hypothetical protein